MRVQSINPDRCQRTGSFGWIDWKKTDACSSRCRFQGFSRAINPGSPTSLPNPEDSEGSATFSITLALEALDPAGNVQDMQDMSSWLAGPS